METLETAVEEYLHRLRSLADFLVGKNESDDLVGDTLLAATEGWPKFRGECSSRTWLVSIMKRQYFARLRAARYRRTRPEVEGAVEDNAVHLHETCEVVQRLDRKHRETVMRFYYCGQSYQEIARDMKVPIGTVRSRLADAKERLRLVTEAA